VPRLITEAPADAIELQDLVAELDAGRFDPKDEDAFASWGPSLKRLANNRNFLGDIILAELKQRCVSQVRGQPIWRAGDHAAPADSYFIRANLWPGRGGHFGSPERDRPVLLPRAARPQFLVPDRRLPRPGYWSDYYEYDYGQVTGYLGEEVDLQFVERSRLELGKVMLYRAHKDVHLQLPADAMSVSINIVETSPCTAFRDQYRFDVSNRTVAGIMTRTSLEPLLLLAAHHGGGNGTDLLEDFAARHPSDRVRWAALKALAGTASDLDDRIAMFERGTSDQSRLVAEMARATMDKLEQSRAWVETPRVLEAAA
jgi:hypothetical protein